MSQSSRSGWVGAGQRDGPLRAVGALTTATSTVSTGSIAVKVREHRWPAASRRSRSAC